LYNNYKEIKRFCYKRLTRKDELMLTKPMKAFAALLFLLAFSPLHNVSADTGPKPGMDFVFNQGFSGSPVPIISGILFECEQSDCQDATPLQELGPQGFSCQASTCHALAYGFSPYHRLEILFSDGKTRQSNIFETAGFNSTYTVTIRQDDLVVKSKFNLNPTAPLTIILLCVCCLAGVIVVAAVILLLVRRSARQK
jgi:hypothetical protein